MLKKSILIAAIVAVGVAAPALSAEGRRPIWEPTVIAPGSGTPGKYFVTRDIVSPGGPVITIAGGPGIDDVEIDLNGFTLFGDGSGVPAIEVAGPIRRVTIRNGEVRDGGLFFDTVERVTVEDVQVASSPTIGIFAAMPLSVVVRNSTIIDSADFGIFVDSSGGPAVTGTVADNVVRDSGADAIRFEGAHGSVAVEHNRVEICGDAGINMLGGEGFLISQNTISGCTDGLRVEASNNSKIYNNVLTRNFRNGMTLLTLGGFLVLDNSSSFNGENGIFVEGFFNKLENNSMMANGRFGLFFGPASTDNVYGKNGARGNSGGACAFVPPVEPCGPAGGGGSVPPDFCNEGVDNTSYCDNLLPGPPLS